MRKIKFFALFLVLIVLCLAMMSCPIKLGLEVCQIIFNSMGGSDVISIDAIKGNRISEPNQPEKIGHIFAGWYQDTTYENAWDFNNDTVESKMTLYARWVMIGPAGGYVFYDKGNYNDGWRYLEAAPSGWSGQSTDPTYLFGYIRIIGDDNITLSTSSSIGSGKNNTELLVEEMVTCAYKYFSGYETTAQYAAKICDDYSLELWGVIYDD